MLYSNEDKPFALLVTTFVITRLNPRENCTYWITTMPRPGPEKAIHYAPKELISWVSFKNSTSLGSCQNSALRYACSLQSALHRSCQTGGFHIAKRSITLIVNLITSHFLYIIYGSFSNGVQSCKLLLIYNLKY